MKGLRFPPLSFFYCSPTSPVHAAELCRSDNFGKLVHVQAGRLLCSLLYFDIRRVAICPLIGSSVDLTFNQTIDDAKRQWPFLLVTRSSLPSQFILNCLLEDRRGQCLFYVLKEGIRL